ncbi:uncharacterized protein LOC141643370 [Silene latifolia]|uniref:uncharacterized protein LOC141643370 n=1 Tax=Silene latifolia TaxID=37657 RepID=UPI003D77EADE
MSLEEVARMIEQQEALMKALKNVGNGEEKSVDASYLNTTISRINHTTYEGTGEPKLRDNWHREMEIVLEVVHYLAEMMVEQAAFCLRDEAGLWWHNEREGARAYYWNLGQPVIPWAGFKRAMTYHFVLEHIRAKLRVEFNSFTMIDIMTITEYYHRFMELSSYAEDLQQSQRSLALCFEKELALKIMENLQAGVIFDLKDFYERAGHAERLVDMAKEAKEKGAEKRKAESDGGNQSSHKRGNHNQARTYSGGPSYGGGSRTWGKGGQSISDNSNLLCFNCGGSGHKRYECMSVVRGRRRLSEIVSRDLLAISESKSS